MLPKPSYSQTSVNGADFRYDGAEISAITRGISQYLEDENYRLESGKPAAGVYGKGSSFWNMAMGSIAGRASFYVEVTTTADGRDVILHLENGLNAGVDAAFATGRTLHEYDRIVSNISQGIGEGLSSRRSA